MANLPESSTFDAGVYQLELTDPVVGGPSGVSNTPLKNLANRTKYLKDHVDALESSRAPLASPALTGTPTAPTAAPGTNTTQLATTAFVTRSVSDSTPDLSPYATKASPTFTGDPKAPTPARFDNDTSLATTEFVTSSGMQYSPGMQIAAAALTYIPASAVGGLYYIAAQCSNGVVVLPDSANLPSGARLTLYSPAASNVDISRGSTNDLIFGVTSDGSGVYGFKMNVGDTVTFYLYKAGNGSASWFAVENSSASLISAPQFAAVKSSSGYQKLPSGLIIQYGYLSLAANSTTTVTLPIAFPTAFRGVVISIADNVSTLSASPLVTALPLNTSQMSVRMYYTASSNAAYYMAIGY